MTALRLEPELRTRRRTCLLCEIFDFIISFVLWRSLLQRDLSAVKRRCGFSGWTTFVLGLHFDGFSRLELKYFVCFKSFRFQKTWILCQFFRTACRRFLFGAPPLPSENLMFRLPSFVNLIEFKQWVFLSLVCLLCFICSLTLKVKNSKFYANVVAVSACSYLRDCSYIAVMKHV